MQLIEQLQRRLITFGLIFISVGFIYGVAYNFYVNRDALLQLKDDYMPAFSQLTEEIISQADGSRALVEIGQTNIRSTQYKRAIGAHAHAINLGLLLILVGMVFSFVMQNSKKARLVAYLLVFGISVYPLGLALQAAGLKLLGEGFALFGATSVVIGFALLLKALFSYGKKIE